MGPLYLPRHGLVLEGHAATLAAPRQSARDWLLAHGVDDFTAEQVTEQAPVARAYYDDEFGFVGVDFPDAIPVTVVHVPAPNS